MPLRFPRLLARTALLAATVLLLAACTSKPAQWDLNDVTGHLPDLDFQLTGDSGKPVTAAAVKGKVVMLYFGYTHCPDVCPLSLTHLHVVMQRLGKLADQVRIVFVSVDPKRDTPEVLHNYVRAFDQHALGLTGDTKKVRKLTKAYRVVFNSQAPDQNGNYEVSHSSAVFIFDRQGRARLISGSADNMQAIAHDVKQLIEEGS
ncbi:MAG: SCO family protein [Rhodanobacteraceae bacterium]